LVQEVDPSYVIPHPISTSSLSGLHTATSSIFLTLGKQHFTPQVDYISPLRATAFHSPAFHVSDQQHFTSQVNIFNPSGQQYFIPQVNSISHLSSTAFHVLDQQHFTSQISSISHLSSTVFHVSGPHL
jgi:hypothetical protein